MKMLCRGILVFVLILLAPVSAWAVNENTPESCKDTLDRIECEMAVVTANNLFTVKVFNQQGGHGTGVVFKDRDGWGILTNDHVIATGFKAWVLFPGSDVAQRVKIIGRDPELDVALLSVSEPRPRGTMPALFGRSADLAVGDRVYTHGYPLGIQSTTVGWVNTLTSIMGHHYFSSQAPVHEGSSGGPIERFNAKGELEVVGINTLLKGTGLLSLSLHIDYVRRMIPRLRTERVVSHARVGILFIDTRDMSPPMYEEIAKDSYPPKRSGVIVVKVEKDSPAEKAGIKMGDMITGLLWNEEPIPYNNAQELQDLIFFDFLPKTKVTFVTLRGTEVFSREVELGGTRPAGAVQDFMGDLEDDR